MKKLLFALPLLCLSLAAQTAETLVYRAVLSNQNEIPVVAGAANGTATIWLHVVRDASGNITSGSADASVSYTFGSPAIISAMHIHSGSSTVNGPVVMGFAVARTEDATTGTLPTLQTQFPTTAVTLDTVRGIVADPSQFYFNLHTVAAPGGAMRAQLQRAEMYVRTAIMRPENEVPAITGTTWSGVGTSVTLITRNATGINSAYQIFDVRYAGFEADQIFTAMHIHLGNAGANGGVTIDSGLRTQVPVPASGTGVLRFESEVQLTRAGAIQSLDAIVNNPAAVYLNAHTVARPGGAIRGQLMFTDRTDFNVNLGPDQEVPPVTAVTAATIGRLSAYTVRNADGSVQAGTVIFDGNVRFPSGQNVTATHIHDGLAGVNGPVTIDGALASQPNLIADGTGNFFRIVTASTAGQVTSLNSLLTNPDRHYWNVHTTANPGGLTRGQMGVANTAAPAVTGVVNSTLDSSQGALAPGGLFTIFGSNFVKVTSNTDGFNGQDMPASLAGASVTVGGRPARLLYVSPTQINAQSPYDAPSITTQVVVTNANGSSTAVSTPSSTFAPAVFRIGTAGIIAKADGTLVSASNPATAGEVITIYATGLGPVTPGRTSGQLATPDATFSARTVRVRFGTATVVASSAALVTGSAGVFGVRVTVPTGLTAGNVSLRIQSESSSSLPFGPDYSVSNAVDLAVR